MDDTLRKKVNEHYQLGQGSIQDIARVYRLTVEEVLEAIGQTELLSVEGVGDLVDQEEAGAETKLKARNIYHANFTTN